MKKLFLVFSIAISGFGFSQAEIKIDYANFNYELLERMVIEEINTHRVSIGLKELYTSKVLKDAYSAVTAGINAKQDMMFHTKCNVSNELAYKLYNELWTTTNGECGERNQLPFISMNQPGEIITGAWDIFNTYNEMANSIVRVWLNSPGHKKVIESILEHYSGRAGQISCCVKKSESNTFYIVVGFVTLDYIPR
jgi:hypothetical protein